MMNLSCSLYFFLILCLYWVSSESQSIEVFGQAYTPPRGWNSYDSFCWTISEQEFLQNSGLVARTLRSYGYEYVVVDYLWYRRFVEGAGVDSLGFDVIDEWGRVIPDPVRWPSSRGGQGFTELARIVHSMGLKLGIHIMRGISTQAVNANTPILDITTGRTYEESGRQWYAKDIGIRERACAWMPHGFMSVDTKLGAGKAFLRSLYQQYVDWGVDFVKHDCVFGDDLDLDEINFASQVWQEINRPIVYSLSPGTSVTPIMAKAVSGLVNMYRITADDWDSWQDVASHFDISRDFSAANMIGAKGLLGKSWPDLDMLPLGWLTDPGVNQGPHRKCNLTLNEQRTQMTLWSMARSPLMFGGDMRNLDETTFSLLTNPILLEINSLSSNNKEFPYIAAASDHHNITNQGISFQTRSLKEMDKTGSFDLHLTSCKDFKARGWFMRSLKDEQEQVCWQGKSRSKNPAAFCLHKRAPLASEKAKAYKHDYQGKFHLLAKASGLCLSASPTRKLTSKEFTQGSFSPCSWDTNQLWEINDNGTLVSTYSGLCASSYVEKDNAIPVGTRSWIATGVKGEIFLAFFNLSPDESVISANISDLSKGLPFRNLSFSSCTGKEIWTGKLFEAETVSLSVGVAEHGCALFVLYCK